MCKLLFPSVASPGQTRPIMVLTSQKWTYKGHGSVPTHFTLFCYSLVSLSLVSLRVTLVTEIKFGNQEPQENISHVHFLKIYSFRAQHFYRQSDDLKSAKLFHAELLSWLVRFCRLVHKNTRNSMQTGDQHTSTQAYSHTSLLFKPAC